ncbi:MAG: NAD(P)-dependent methylenetetrahydromethanopterin dehydrogenase [Gammaproteobacteria bacterium]|nr:methylenetetrahydromethanopterin dehydrogenase [Gammaproteobacteria bacterium]
MERPFILHIFTPGKNVSPFDANMAIDAGWQVAMPYTNVEADEIRDLVQDAIFSRGPSGVRRTGIFVGGRDLHIAMDMLKAAEESMVPPFEVSVFADPSGAFTTAAGMVAKVEQQLADKHGASLEGLCVLALGGTGPVGAAASVLAAKAGARVKIIGRKIDKARQVAEICNQRYGADLTGIEGEADDHKGELIKIADVMFATAKAGVEVLSRELIASAPRLKVAADANAVPPPGIAGVDAKADGVAIEGSKSGAVGIGALAIGDVKYHVQQRLLKQMVNSDEPVYLHFEHAFKVAREYVAKA